MPGLRHVDWYGIRSSSLAALTLLTYDYALTLEDEIEFVWKRSWSFGKALYIANRYFGTGALLFSTIETFADYSKISCASVLHFRIWTHWATLFFIEVLLLARVYAIYDRNGWLLATLICSFLGEFGTAIFFLYGQANTTIREGANPVPSNCFYSTRQVTLVKAAEIWLPLLTYIGMLCILVLYKAWIVYREDKPGKFYRTIVLDCLRYYISILLVVGLNFLFFLLSPAGVTNPQWSLPWLGAIPILTSGRMFLNTRREYYKKRTFPSLNVITVASATGSSETSAHYNHPSRAVPATATRTGPER